MRALGVDMEFRGANYQVFVDATGPFIEVWGQRYDVGNDGKVVTSGPHPPIAEPTRENPLLGMLRDDGKVVPTDFLGRPIHAWDGTSPIYVDEHGPYITRPGGEGGDFRIDVGGNAGVPSDGSPDRLGTPAITHRVDPTGHLVPTDSQGNPLPPLDVSGLGAAQVPVTFGAVEAGAPDPTAGGPTDFGHGAGPGWTLQHPAPDAPPLHIGGDFTSPDPSAASPGPDLGTLLGFNTGATGGMDPGDPGANVDPLTLLLGAPTDGGHTGPVDAGATPSDSPPGLVPTEPGPVTPPPEGGGSGTTLVGPATTPVDPSPPQVETHADPPPPPANDPSNRAPFDC
jgi:hypothetical protein